MTSKVLLRLGRSMSGMCAVVGGSDMVIGISNATTLSDALLMVRRRAPATM